MSKLYVFKNHKDMTLTEKLDYNISRLNTTVILAEESNLPRLKQRAEDFIHIAYRVQSLHNTLVKRGI
jgi:hypothetical protein